MRANFRLGSSVKSHLRPIAKLHVPLLVTGLLIGSLGSPLASGAVPRQSPPAQTAYSRGAVIQPGSQSRKIARMEAQVFQQINQFRSVHGLRPLKFNSRLAQVARGYSQQMAQYNFYSHRGLRGDSPRQRVEAAGMQAYLVGENLMKCPCTRRSRHPVKTSVRSWMNSSGHRRNILLPSMQETGVGIWRRGNTYYLTQLFIEPK